MAVAERAGGWHWAGRRIRLQAACTAPTAPLRQLLLQGRAGFRPGFWQGFSHL